MAPMASVLSGRQRGCQRIALFVECAVHALEGILAHAPVTVLHIEDVIALRQLDILALAILDDGQLQIGVVNHAENLRGRVERLASLCQQRLDLCRAHMGLAAQQFVQRMTIEFQARFLAQEAFQPLLGNRQNLRREEGSCRAAY